MSAAGSGRPSAVWERWNRAFRLLAAEPRRQVILSLADAPVDEQLPLPGAAESPNRRDDPEQLRVHLRHRHLPMLEEAGYVRWTDDPFVVRRGPDFEEAASILQTLQTNAGALPGRLVDGCYRLEREVRE